MFRGVRVERDHERVIKTHICYMVKLRKTRERERESVIDELILKDIFIKSKSTIFIHLFIFRYIGDFELGWIDQQLSVISLFSWGYHAGNGDRQLTSMKKREMRRKLEENFFHFYSHVSFPFLCHSYIHPLIIFPTSSLFFFDKFKVSKTFLALEKC